MFLEKGFLVHSSVLSGDDQCYLFCGRSGAGKSTIASKGVNHGWSVYSDDLNAIKQEEGGFYVHKTNFTGTFSGATASDSSRKITAVRDLERCTSDSH